MIGENVRIGGREDEHGAEGQNGLPVAARRVRARLPLPLPLLLLSRLPPRVARVRLENDRAHVLHVRLSHPALRRASRCRLRHLSSIMWQRW